ncbi:MAG: hypothetical protein ABSB58_06480 [Gemmatimonadales bacterium]|jgi:hypothetical protein
MDHLSRSVTALALAALLGAGAAAAQAPFPAPQAPPVAALHSVWFDAAALADDEFRGGVEAFTVGRFTLGASVGFSHTAHPRADLVGPIVYGGVVPLSEGDLYPVCNPQFCGGGYSNGDAQRYRAWTAALTARFYPASFSFRNGASRMMVYAGAHAGLRWSTWDETLIYYGCTTYCPPYAYPLAGSASGRAPRPSPADSVNVFFPPNPYPYPIVSGPNPVRHSRGGFEPGLDVGVRFLPVGPLFMEVGGRFTLVTADDLMRRTRPGDVESRLVLAAGFAW